ncbi:hypothetical protein AAVH_28439 [Aphelenchoides avenae]|nr:hypothetical protein AAVH_28439 [Aphelenchus avenae]
MVDLHLPTAVVIVAGRKYSHGRKEIREVYESLMRKCDNIVFHPERGCVTTDGDYLISRGSVVMADREMHYESVFRRDANGKYLICHDVFMLSGKSKL